jgi:diguanylate cyclase (GGDEF)-like protein
MREATALSAAAYLPKPSSILLIDVDNPGQLRDSLGSEAADDVLSKVVEIARQHLRTGDLLFRHGSDALVALLVQTDYLTAQSIANRVQTAAQNTTRRFRVTVTASGLSEHDTSVDDLIAKARDVMQRKRRHGLSPGSPRDSVH